VRIDPKRDDHEYGRFAWIWDPEGNRVELWRRCKTGSYPWRPIAAQRQFAQTASVEESAIHTESAFGGLHIKCEASRVCQTSMKPF